MNVFLMFNNNNGLIQKFSFLEIVVPLLLLYTIIIIIQIYKNKINQSTNIDIVIRFTLGILLSFFFIIGYILLWINDGGINMHNLPLGLCSISMILTIILTFTKNKDIYSFVIFAGVLGGLLRMIVPDINYSFKDFRYYQYMISNGLLVITPLYFLIIHGYIPTLKNSITSVIVIQLYLILIALFNFYNFTNYMYIIVDPDASHNFSLIKSLGGYPWYLISVEFIMIFLIFTWYFVIHNVLYKANNNQDQIVNINSAYITKKKDSRFQR